MTYQDFDPPPDPSREELSSPSVSIAPVPVDEIDEGEQEAREQRKSGQKGKIKSKFKKKPKATLDSEEDIKREALRQVLPDVHTPSGHVAKYLFASENYVGEWRKHWIRIVGWVALVIVSPFIIGYLIGMIGPASTGAVWLVLVLWLVLLGFFGWMIAEWWLERFVLTDKRVMLISGILSRRVAMMPLARVTDMAYVQSPLGMALNYGNFVLESAGQDQALREIKPLPQPNELYLLFCQELYDPGVVAKALEENSPERDYAAD